MGRRSRKRAAGSATAERRPAPPVRTRHGRAVTPNPLDERPKAPWHPFPLVELAVLVGLVLIVLGLFVVRGDRGRIMLLFGLALGSLGGLDTALREHLAGYKSHSTLLAGVPAVLVAGVLVIAGAPQIAVPLAAAVVFAAAFGLARGVFRTRSGGRKVGP
jgi:hypothetical protein